MLSIPEPKIGGAVSPMTSPSMAGASSVLRSYWVPPFMGAALVDAYEKASLTSMASRRGDCVREGAPESVRSLYSSKASFWTASADDPALRRSRSSFAHRKSRKSYSSSSRPTRRYSLEHVLDQMIWTAALQAHHTFEMRRCRRCREDLRVRNGADDVLLRRARFLVNIGSACP